MPALASRTSATAPRASRLSSTAPARIAAAPGSLSSRHLRGSSSGCGPRRRLTTAAARSASGLGPEGPFGSAADGGGRPGAGAGYPHPVWARWAREREAREAAAGLSERPAAAAVSASSPSLGAGEGAPRRPSDPAVLAQAVAKAQLDALLAREAEVSQLLEAQRAAAGSISPAGSGSGPGSDSDADLEDEIQARSTFVLLEEATMRDLAMMWQEDGTTALHLAVGSAGAAAVAVLLSWGADPNAAKKDGTTPLHIAAELDDADEVAALAAHTVHLGPELKAGGWGDGASPIYWLWQDGTTPLHIAAARGHLAAARALIDANAELDDPRSDGSTPLHLAAEGGHAGVVKALLDAGAEVMMETLWGATPLYLAAWRGHVGPLRPLIMMGARVNARTKARSTPLHAACSEGHVGAAEVLLAEGADYEAANQDGWTPLIAAAVYGHTGTVRVMLQAGAGRGARDTNVSWSDWIVYKNSSTNPGWWNATTYPGPPQQFFTCSGSEPSVNNCPNYAFVPTVGCVAAAVSCPGVQYGTPNQVNHPGAATAASPALLLHAALAMLALALAVLMS
ncbi:hypothetical protein HYH03_018254 [Edaphochlamys debaryana]|uniref:Uncharacterized protein n=1 Tax=Edaphochlamys debaryana TaxID=47281 RepID=A0A835XHE2_9CHLO|nr:hypothetical protein HYH03_018254 [Edaphochlamys debaryana]|eukprot:KAG2482813.1 hypothetical protein HYH03_018254 [Edaphochlamys debaryana]